MRTTVLCRRCKASAQIAPILEVVMAVGVTKNVGLLLLAIWLIVSGLAGLTAIGLPPVIMPVLALLAGIMILIGR